jgi:hypothetical protein
LKYRKQYILRWEVENVSSSSEKDDRKSLEVRISSIEKKMDELINMLSPSREFTEDDIAESNKIIYLPTPPCTACNCIQPCHCTNCNCWHCGSCIACVCPCWGCGLCAPIRTPTKRKRVSEFESLGSEESK